MSKQMFSDPRPLHRLLSKKGLLWIGCVIPCISGAQEANEQPLEAVPKSADVFLETAEVAQAAPEPVAFEDRVLSMASSKQCCATTASCPPSPCAMKECFPVPCMSLTADFLYFQAQLENLMWAVKAPQELNNFFPRVAVIETDWRYQPGVRLALDWSMDDTWEMGLNWMYFDAHPPTASATNLSYGIFDSMNTAGLGGGGNSLSRGVAGKWRMNMNVFSVEITKPFCIGNYLAFRPILGVQAGLFSHKIHISYSNLAIAVPGITYDPTAPTATTVKGSQWIWSVGPEAALETRFATRKKFDFFLRGAYAAMIASYDARTFYTNFALAPAGAPPNGVIKMNRVTTMLVSMVQLQAAVSKRWSVGEGLVEVMVGWETQIWDAQNLFLLYSNLTPVGRPGNLTLMGPFGRLFYSF